MAFKMKNPSMAKLTKVAGDNRVAMKMKMEEKAATKMKKEAAMKMKKEESMAKLMDKASAMKLKKDDAAMKLKKESPVKKEKEDGTTTEKGITRNKDGKIISYSGEAAVKRMAQLEMNTNPGMTMEEAMKYARNQIKKSKSAAPKMKKKPSPAKQKMSMVKGPDGKMVPDFAVDGKGANDMKSGAKMKKPMKMKKGEPMKLKKKDSAVKMVKRVDPKVNKLKEMETRQPKPIPNKGRVKPLPKPKPIKVKPIKAQKSPKVTARF